MIKNQRAARREQAPRLQGGSDVGTPSWGRRAGVFVACAGAVFFASARAEAQVATFKLDRLEVWGAPDDGIGVMRPVTNDKPIFYAQLGIGFAYNPLHTSNITSDTATLAQSNEAVIQGQFAQYLSVGFQFLDHFTLAATLPIYEEWGNTPNYQLGLSGNSTDVVGTGPGGAGDMRIDARAVAWRTADRRGAIGAGASVFVPTASNPSTFLGDGQATAMLMLTGEYNFHIVKDINVIGVLNTGFAFRNDHVINQPTLGSGLGEGTEWRWAVGGYLPLAQDKYRLGLNIYGQTGLVNDSLTGNTFFHGVNTPFEWQAEGRMRLGTFSRFWVGAGGGTRFDQAYGAPDFRIVLLAGFYVPLINSDANSPEAKLERRKKWKDLHEVDTDHDGIPDDIDACPTEPEDHLGNDPTDGCPMPADRDGDGIPDQYDKCPDVYAQTADGCPADTDKDGIPDSVDACPREPGQPSPDPKKNGCPQFIKLEGSVVRVLQQVHFATASTTILPDSFPMLQEIANLLKANPSIHRMSIEGHTDNRGNADYNMTLSQGRATSVMTWLTQHGIEQSRLEAHGYGLTKPIADNNTDAGRLANRRVEFKITEEGDIKKPAPAPGGPSSTPKP